MPERHVIRFVGQHIGHADCGVAAFAMMLGLSYAQALVTISSVQPQVLESGVSIGDLQRAAKKKKVRLKLIRRPDLEEGDWTGILSVRFIEDGKSTDHAVFLWEGLIFDGGSDSVWKPDVYLRNYNADVLSILVEQ